MIDAASYRRAEPPYLLPHNRPQEKEKQEWQRERKKEKHSLWEELAPPPPPSLRSHPTDPKEGPNRSRSPQRAGLSSPLWDVSARSGGQHRPRGPFDGETTSTCLTQACESPVAACPGSIARTVGGS